MEGWAHQTTTPFHPGPTVGGLSHLHKPAGWQGTHNVVVDDLGIGGLTGEDDAAVKVGGIAFIGANVPFHMVVDKVDEFSHATLLVIHPLDKGDLLDFEGNGVNPAVVGGGLHDKIPPGFRDIGLCPLVHLRLDFDHVLVKEGVAG